MKVKRMADRHHSDRQPHDSFRVLMEVRSLEYRYPDGHKALDGIDLIIRSGERIAVMGSNGAGKTTLARHLNGLIRPGSGEIYYKGHLLAGAHLSTARLEIGMLFQDPDDQLFCNTLNEDVSFGPFNQNLTTAEVAERVSCALARTGLGHLRYKAPHHLSYGQRKRAAFATILAMNPQILVLDEPTTNFDPKQKHHLAHLIAEFTSTIICISHDLLFLETLCSRAVVLQKGKIIRDSSMRDILSDRDFLCDFGFQRLFPATRPATGKGMTACNTAGASPPSHSETHGNTPDGLHKKSHRQGLIQLKNCSYRYPDGTWGIRDVSFSVAEGENVAVMGENGAGKSTLLACLAGVLEGKGEYVFDSLPVSGKHRRNLWRHIGIVFQDPADQLLFPSTREEVAFGLKRMGLGGAQIAERVSEALAMVGLGGFEDRVPHHLSSGERKRVALASVLTMSPRVLVLDEPTANLDPKNEVVLYDILRSLPVTKIVVSHEINVISSLCERTIVLHDGRIVRDCSTAALLADESLIETSGLDYTVKSEFLNRMMDP